MQDRFGVEACDVVLNNNRTKLVSWRRSASMIQLSVNWALLSHDDLLLQVLDEVPGAWQRLRALAPPPRPVRGVSRGRVHDLAPLLSFQRDLLPGAPDLPVRWGRWPTQVPRRTLQLGAHSATGIRIHPVLDHALVPDWFVAFILFHELLHAVIPPVPGVRRQVHPPAFRERERAHSSYHRARQWEHQNIGWLMQRCGDRIRENTRY